MLDKPGMMMFIVAAVLALIAIVLMVMKPKKATLDATASQADKDKAEKDYKKKVQQRQIASAILFILAAASGFKGFRDSKQSGAGFGSTNSLLRESTSLPSME